MIPGRRASRCRRGCDRRCSRQAFYLHFGSKEELLLSHIDDVFDQIRATVLPSPTRARAVGLRELLATSFAEWARHATSLRLALQIEDKDRLIERMRIHAAGVMDAFAEHGRDEVVAHHRYPSRDIFALIQEFTGPASSISPRIASPLWVMARGQCSLSEGRQ